MRSKLFHRACLSGLCLVLIFGMTAFQTQPPQATYIPIDGSWTGTTSRGYPMSFTVSSSGTQWSTFKVKTDFSTSSCGGASGTIETTVPGPGSITNNQFSYTSSTFSFTGQFNSATTATGTYSFTNMRITIGIPYPPYVCYAYFTQSGTWSATTPLPLPGYFSKSSPADGATVQSINLALIWNTSSYADTYQYCIDEVDNDACDTSWEPNPATSNTSVEVPGLAGGKMYYWQVRASNSTGPTNADAGDWWSVTFNLDNAPTDIALSNDSVAENQPIGTTVGTLSTTDLDAGDTHTYDFACTTPGADDASFDIVGNALNTAEVFNHEAKNSHAICIRTNDGHGGTYDENFTITVTDVLETITATLRSTGAQDGWILESGETTNAGGNMDSAATTLRIGDDPLKKQYRSILSFATGGPLPDTAVITKVTLKVKQQAVVGGGNPVTFFQGFMLDIRNGTFGTSALQLTDWQTATPKIAGPFTPAPVSGWYSFNLTSAKAYINRLPTGSGLTQIRLRFKLDDNNNTVANYLSLYSGSAPLAYRPVLVIEYHIP